MNSQSDSSIEISWCSKDATLESECGQFESARKELCCAMIHFVRNEGILSVHICVSMMFPNISMNFIYCVADSYILSKALEYTPSAEPRRLRSVFSDRELDEWVDNLDDGDIDYFYDLMVNGQTDDVMDAFWYDVAHGDYSDYGDYVEFDDYGRYDDNYYDIQL